MAKQTDIERQVDEALNKRLQALGLAPMAAEPVDPKERADYIEFGSAEHAELLGIRKATENDPLDIEGWTLVDMTAFGPQASENYVREVLRQKVSEWKAGPPPIPDRAPGLWHPNLLGVHTTGIT